ncbi:MAG: RNA polymerase sigma factor [Chitinophagaceae bacterium]|nr:RNA polymerase sigma factor [Chitinophagaceae bacterium]
MSNSEFNQLLTSNVDFLKPVAITLTRDPDAAADLYQETLYKALANREKYSVGTNIRAWLYTIMRNIFINNYRRKAKQNTIFDSSSDDSVMNKLKASVSNSAESMLEVKYIQKAVHGLPDVFRYPLVLYFEGYKYHDIAGMLKEPLGTIKSRIHFARKLLKSQLQRY